jgi:short-subunit dehydrogenase
MAQPGQTALVTGASSGIGLALSELFARDGWRLVLVARSGERLVEIATDFKARYGAEAVALPVDLAQAGSAERLFEEVERRGIAVDALVNNAGFATYGYFAELPLDDERHELQLNVLTLTELTKLFLKPMLLRKRGRILNVASTAAFAPGPLMAVYYASKAYVLSFSEALGNELRGSGVTVTCLAPGATESQFQARGKLGESAMVKGRKLPSATSVALAGYRAMLAGKRLEIPGARNVIDALLPRFGPRGLIVRIVRRINAPRG